MKKSLSLSLASFLLLAPGASAYAEQACPVTHQGDSFLDDVVKEIEKAPSCVRADAIAAACALGASGDNAIVAPALTRCETAFKGRLNKRQQRTYAAQRRKCVRKYARKSGTMYLSMAAFCGLNVAKKFAARYGARK